MSRHRAPAVRPRWGRMLLAGAAATVTAVALVGGVAAGDDDTTEVTTATDPNVTAVVEAPPAAAAPDAATVTPEAGGQVRAGAEVVAGATLKPDKTLPGDSGSGYRVVFSESRQRVWLVGSEDTVERTYPVSGSVYDNLDPGTYEVYSRSEQAYGIDDSGTMKYFVRFTQGDNAAIGFHDIPVDDGEPVQTVAQLGTPLSHGCIRQKRPDAIALWEFAPIGTSVVVTA